jgi:hypothetical protein
MLKEEIEHAQGKHIQHARGKHEHAQASILNMAKDAR